MNTAWDETWREALRPQSITDKRDTVEALVRLRVREVGSEHDFALWTVECKQGLEGGV